MKKSIKEVFGLTNRYIVLATPLILYTLFSSICFFMNSSGKIINLIIGFIICMLMNIAFIAGWIKMLKSAVDTPYRNEPNSLLKEFIPGVGEYVLPVLGAVFNITVLGLAAAWLIYYIGMKFIGHLGLSMDSMQQAIQSGEAMKIFVSSLSQEQLEKINAWSLLIFVVQSLFMFVLMFYFPAIANDSKNPFKALFISLKKIFSKKILFYFSMFLSLYFTYLLIAIFETLSESMAVLHFVITLLKFYYLVFISVAVFYYYNDKEIKGQNVDKVV